jgi:hypothetical protein
MIEKIGTGSLVTTFKPFIDSVTRAFEEASDGGQVIAGDPDKPVLSFDSFVFKQFPEGTLDSRMFRGMTVVRGKRYASLVGMGHMGERVWPKDTVKRLSKGLLTSAKTSSTFIMKDMFWRTSKPKSLVLMCHTNICTCLNICATTSEAIKMILPC